MLQTMLTRGDPPQLGGGGKPLGLELIEGIKVTRLGAERLASAQYAFPCKNREQIFTGFNCYSRGIDVQQLRGKKVPTRSFNRIR